MPFFRQFPKTTYDFLNSGIDTQITDIFRFVQADIQLTDDTSTYQYYQIRDGDRPDVVSTLLYGTPEYYWTFFLCNDTLKTGLTSWPMSQLQFDEYIATEYDGTAIITRPTLVWDAHHTQVTEYRDSLAGRFLIGETITGGTSGATGTLFSKDAQLSQMILRQVNGNFLAPEQLYGFQSEDIVSTFENVTGQTPSVLLWRDAPHHYVKADGTISYDALYIDEQNTFLGLDNPPDVVNNNLTAVSNYDYELTLNEQRSSIRVIRPDLIYTWAQTFKDLVNNGQ